MARKRNGHVSSVGIVTTTYVDSVMAGTDAAIVPRLIDFYGGGTPVLDVTYGAGRFWRTTVPQGLITLDLLPGAGLQANHRHLPLKNGVVGTIIYDPPHLRRAVRPNDPNAWRQSVQWIYNLASWDADYRPFLYEARRVLRPGGVVIAKIGDELLRWPWGHVDFITRAHDAGLIPWDIVVKMRHPSIRNPTQRQLRARRRHCFYIILKKKTSRRED